MTDDTLRPLLPSFNSPSIDPSVFASGPALPMGSVEQPVRSSAVHSIRAVDTNGRVVDKTIVDALGWRPGDLLSWRVTGGLVLITRPGFGRRGITKYGHLALPARTRHEPRVAAPKKYPDELKARAVRLYLESDPKPTIRKLAQQLGVHHEALRNWIRQADPGQRPEPADTDLAEENKRLRKQVAELERVNDILRSASAYFASELGQTRR